MNRLLFLLILLLASHLLYAQRVVNVYAWGGEIPKKVIQQFEHQTGITVNFSTYDSNETMYAKLKASSKSIYDVILPSAYFVERMRKQGMLSALDHNQLSNIGNIENRFTHNDYDPGNRYSVPIIWGATGIFYNQVLITNPPKAWRDLWQKRWRKQLMLLDDSREVFAIALMSLGFDPNDANPEHIAAAYNHLLQLVPNIKLFASDSIQAIMIDEDAIAGTAWNGDAFKAQAENNKIKFNYPKEGFVIWVDCLAIPKNPPHPKEAYEFINFILRPDVGAKITLTEGHAITNLKSRALLPELISKNPIVYPSDEVLKHGYFQRDVGEETLALYNKYWQQLKLAF
ncbi:spermidine/putrescine transport system substrate-binding protein [Legionella lansingensis]|uniref:Putrescine-binding periplasmic protein n=1 Tax=Legionella lansingensis TaxID=45067 RepID=A0A0W0VJX8_9GAMM|nr:spermidine/putrescine ABC transporter substrate-binding protein [Legionella lansingensis]KTD20398.1 spermidine/putrescine-binding periplasmic protein PotD [Legionella lansingensis]SNV51593.1 spermidine/putrescine transport system substrate-binding protein [Legionella lansingensis]